MRRLHAQLEARPLRFAAIAFTFLAYGWNWFALAPMSLVKPWYPAVSHLGGALIVAWCTLMLLRLAFPRERPHRALALAPVWGAPASRSFPSGHAAGAFTIAAFFAGWLAPLASPRDTAIVLVLFGLASGVAWSRVALAVHYPTDVASGAILGATCGFVASHVG